MIINRIQIERIIIECPMEDAKKAVDYITDNGYRHTGWSGAARNRDPKGPTLDETRFHCEGEKEISQLRGIRPNMLVIDEISFLPEETQP